MRILRLFSVLGLFLWFLLSFGINSVLGQTDTPAPSPTYEPLWVTNTPNPTVDYSCPDDNPIGWGAITPNPAWYINCSQCIKYPTSTPEGLPTSTPTSIYTPTITPTPAPKYYYMEYYDFFDYAWYRDVSFNFTINWDAPVCPGGDLLEGVIARETGYCEGPDTPGARGYLHQSGTSPQWYAMGIYYEACRLDAYRTLTEYSNVAGYNGAGKSAMLASYAGVTVNHNQIFDGVDNRLTFTYFSQIGSVSDFTLWYGEIEIMGALCYGDSENLLVTPTPTPVIDSYCDQVIEEQEGGYMDITLPVPLVGQGTIVGMGGYEWNTEWLANIGELVGLPLPDTISIPYIGFNFRPIYFGTISFVGIDFPIDAIILIMAVIGAARLLWRS